MFKAVEPLNKETHKELRLKPMPDLAFVKELTQVPLGYTEFIQAARYFPIIFTVGDNPMPHAILSLQKGKNSFINTDGKWSVPYIPAHIRRYPFILGKAKTEAEKSKDDDKGNEQRFVVCIDRDAACFSTTEGDRLFLENGEPSETTEKAFEFLKKYQQEMLLTNNYIKLLQENDCLQTRQLSLKVDGKPQNLGAFQVANLNKLKDIDEAKLAEWVKIGLVGLMYAQNFSLANLDRFAAGFSTAMAVPGNETVH